MKALSIRQPWAWLIIQGYKDVENRTWRSDFRGSFFIHAGYIFDEGGYRYVVRELGLALPRTEEFERGGIVGKAEVIDCVTFHKSPWFIGPYGFVLKNAQALPFMAMQGKPGFFDVNVPGLHEKVREK